MIADNAIYLMFFRQFLEEYLLVVKRCKQSNNYRFVCEFHFHFLILLALEKVEISSLIFRLFNLKNKSLMLTRLLSIIQPNQQETNRNVFNTG